MVKHKKGNADVAFFIGFFVVLFILWWVSYSAQKSGKTGGLLGLVKKDDKAVIGSQPVGQGGNTDTGRFNKDGEPISAWSGKVSIASLGNAKSEYKPSREYIVLQAKSTNKEKVNITGWILSNGRNRNQAALQISQQKGVPNQVYLPEARVNSLAGPNYYFQPVVLDPGNKAIVVSGYSPYYNYLWFGASFRTNICVGYADQSVGGFSPSLKKECPDPQVEPGIEYLDTFCRQYIAKMPRCHVPKINNYVEKNGRRLNISSVDNKTGFSTECIDFLREHYSYQGCAYYHGNNKKFYGTEWRVFLNRSWELWAKGEEVITLYDNNGRVVDQKSY